MRKNKNKKKFIENLIIFGFFLIFISFLEINIDKSGVNLNANEHDYITINTREMINALEKGNGVYLIVNDDKNVSRIMNILFSLKANENIYLYNAKNDEIILDKVDNEIKIIQQASSQYNILLSKLGSYKDIYVLDGEITDYCKINTPTVLFIKNGDILYSYYLSNNKIDDELLTETYLKGFSLLNELN